MIALEGITKVFESRGIAGVRDLHLQVDAGSILAVMGPNGCGKTTLLNIIAGELKPDSGKVRSEGRIHFFRHRSPASGLNVQKFLMDSISFEADQEKKVQLSRDLAAIFEFTFQLRQNIGQLSAGQLQKVLMAAELIDQPDILFLDEPFVHLDPMTRKEILESLFQYLRFKGVTVVWVTHDRDEALRFSDRIALMQHGRFEQTDSPVHILTNPRNLFVAQFFGHQNFIKISRDTSGWETPWGKIQHALTASEGYLVIPPQAWRLDPVSPLEGRIIKKFPRNFTSEFEVEWEEKRLLVLLELSAFGRFDVGEKLKISPDLRQCLVIPL